MVLPIFIDMFKAALREADTRGALFRLALQVRDGGSSQVDLYFLFSHFQKLLSPEDPRHGAVVATIDLIRARGGGLFMGDLNTAVLQVDRVVPPPWIEIDASDASLEHELARELAPGHVLEGRAVRALMRRADCDDVLFAIRNSPEVALVHLTWASSRESPGFPSTTIFPSLLEWYENVEKEPFD